MSDEEELELQALQRQLDDAFQVTRPRPAFEDELWLRMQAHRPIWQRLRDGLGGLIDGMREAPGVPATAVAILLVVVLGAGIVKYGGLLPGAGTASLAPAGQDTGTKGGAEAPREFGDSLPVPALQGSTVPTDHAVTSPAYYSGAATLVWAGKFDVTASSLPVYRYREPTAQDAEQFAAALGAAPAAQQTPGSLGTYSGDNFVLVVTGSVARPAKEPSFNLSELSARTAAGTDPVRVATSYLAARSLIPAWSYQTEVTRAGNITRVWFVRLFDTNQGQVPLVDGKGARYGIEVEIKSGQPRVVETGPLPLAIDSATYPVITSDQAIRAVLATSAAPSAGTPVVRLTKAELVYVLAWAGDHSFYEPAYLFSGTFIDQGVTKVKLVLVPAVGPSFLSP
jgi:hypothetical protein